MYQTAAKADTLLSEEMQHERGTDTFALPRKLSYKMTTNFLSIFRVFLLYFR